MRYILCPILVACIAFASPARADETNFPRSVANVLQSEGCTYENHPADPGGPTKCGITIYDVRRFLKPNATANDVKALTRDTAIAIYHDKYWKSSAVRGPEWRAGLDYTLFDYAVNSGTGRVPKVLERIVGLTDGSHTLTTNLLLEVLARDPADMIRAVNAERLRFLRSLHTWPVFGRGWGKRVASVQRISLLMLNAPPGLLSAPDHPARGPGKAYEPLSELEEIMP